MPVAQPWQSPSGATSPKGAPDSPHSVHCDHATGSYPRRDAANAIPSAMSRAHVVRPLRTW
jgi:hypothetical protein